MLEDQLYMKSIALIIYEK